MKPQRRILSQITRGIRGNSDYMRFWWVNQNQTYRHYHGRAFLLTAGLAALTSANTVLWSAATDRTTGSRSVGAAFQLGGKLGVGRCGGIEKTSLISLTSEERRTRPQARRALADEVLHPLDRRGGVGGHRACRS
jgi:hypothetical protein